MTASFIYKIVDGATTFLPGDYLFDTGAQMATLIPAVDGTPRAFSSAHAAVQIVFSPGKPVTETYLKSQPLSRGTLNLNESTPPFQKGVGGNTLMPRYGGRNQTLTPPETRPTLTFFEIRDSGQTGLIACYDEGAMGDYRMEMHGPWLTERFQAPNAAPYDQRASSPGAFLHASGGGYVAPVADGSGKVRPHSFYALGGVVGPAPKMAVIYPNARSSANQGAGRMEITGMMRIPGAETFPSFTDEWLNPPPL
jgi:hypothetical protein